MRNRYNRFYKNRFYFGDSRIKIDNSNPDKEDSLNNAINQLNIIFLEKTKTRKGKKNHRSKN